MFENIGRKELVSYLFSIISGDSNIAQKMNSVQGGASLNAGEMIILNEVASGMKSKGIRTRQEIVAELNRRRSESPD